MRVLALTSTLLAVAAAPGLASKPPVSLKLSEDTFAAGDHAKVHVKAAESGSLVVLQMDASGHVNVLYPLNPDDRATITGGRDKEIRGRGGRAAFTVTERNGSGMVLAALAEQPFDFSALARGSRWDLRALAAMNKPDLSPEEVLLEAVDRMTNGHYDYDAESYTVAPRRYVHAYPFWGFGPWYPGYAYDPWYYRPFGFGVRVGRDFDGDRR